MKTCIDCQETKAYENFVPKASCKDGYEVRCRTCRAIKYNKADPFKFFKKLYAVQINSSGIRNHSAPSYTLDQFYHWLDAQPQLIPLWKAWVASNYDSNLTPSVDRINDSIGYTLDNIQLMTWRENANKGAKSKMAGTVNADQRAVSAYYSNGTFYKTFHSTIEAARYVKGKTWGIYTVADGKPVKDGRGYYYNPQTYKGFTWKWA